MLSGPIAAMVWEGREAVKTGRSTWMRPSDVLDANQESSSRCNQPSAICSRHHSWWLCHCRSLSYSLCWSKAFGLLTSRTLAAMSATAPTLWRVRRRKSLCGSTRAKCSVTHRLNTAGSMRNRGYDFMTQLVSQVFLWAKSRSPRDAPLESYRSIMTTVDCFPLINVDRDSLCVTEDRCALSRRTTPYQFISFLS